MARKLELIREEKLFRLIPGRTRKSRLEASGVALANATTALVVFDNLNQIARIDVSLQHRSSNRLVPAPSLGSGFEDVAVDAVLGRTFGLIESVEEADGVFCGYVSEYDRGGRFLRCTRLPSKFEKANKGFEGLAHVRVEDREYLYALREANFRSSGRRAGRIDIYVRASSGGWQESRWFQLPEAAKFKDYSALAYRDHQLAIVSQESARLWIGRLNPKTQAVIPGSDAVYRFPGKHYQTIEGIAWLSDDTLVAVSDRRKKAHSDRSATKDQSIHVFRIPAG
jgi:uncharacterized protein YjiK